MKFSRIILLAVTALIPAASVLAHNPLAHPEWCTEEGRLLIVDEFAWSGDDMANMVRRGDSDSCPIGEGDPSSDGERTCGQFDDDWLQAFRLSSAHCAQFSVVFDSGAHPDYGTVTPIAVGPEEFLDVDHHHELYFIELGLSGACVRCEPKTDRPIRPIEAGR